MITTSDAAATSAGEAARDAPAATSSSTGPGLREWTVSGRPASSRCPAMGRPMMPSPMKPTRSPTQSSIASSPIASASSITANVSASCASSMISGGLVMTLHHRTIV